MIPVRPQIASRARVKSLEQYQELYRRSLDEPTEFWAEQAERLTWFHKPLMTMRSELDEVDFAWDGDWTVDMTCRDCQAETRAGVHLFGYTQTRAHAQKSGQKNVVRKCGRYEDKDNG